MNAYVRIANASATNTNWPTTSERAVAISGLLSRQAPTIGSTHCRPESMSARISASWPSSGIMLRSSGLGTRGSGKKPCAILPNEQYQDRSLPGLQETSLEKLLLASRTCWLHPHSLLAACDALSSPESRVPSPGPVRRLRLGDRVGDFLGHVGLVVLGQHLRRGESAAAHVAGRDHALSLAEQVGKDAGVLHAHVLEAVGDREVGGERARHPVHAAFLDDAAQPERRARRRLAGCHFGWRIQVGHVLLQREHGQRRGDADREHDQRDHDQSAFADGIHAEAPSRCAGVCDARWRRSCSRAARPRNSFNTWRRRSAGAIQSQASTAKNTAYAGQTYMA